MLELIDLISLEALDSGGYKFTSEGGALKVSKSTLVVNEGYKNWKPLQVGRKVLKSMK